MIISSVSCLKPDIVLVTSMTIDQRNRKDGNLGTFKGGNGGTFGGKEEEVEGEGRESDGERGRFRKALCN